MSEYMQQGDPPNFADEPKITYCKRAINGSEQLVLLTKAQKEKREKIKNDISFSQLGPVFKYFAHCSNLSLTMF